LVLAAACSNNPYRPAEKGKNYLYSSFLEPPKHLDPAVSYSSDEYTFIQQIYEPPLEYHYLKRPYKLIPLTATEVPQAEYVDAEGNTLPGDPPAEKVTRAIYTVKIKKGILYQNHPCFAKNRDGRYRYHHLTEDQMAVIEDIDDFPYAGTRELTAHDYIYQIKRLAHPKLECPLLSTMAKYILGLDKLAQSLQSELSQIRAARKRQQGALYNQEKDERKAPIRIDLDQFPLEGTKAIDKYTFQIILTQKYPQFVYWLAMPFFSPMPWEADQFFEQAPLVALNLKLDNRPVGTGPFRMDTFLPNKEIILVKNENFHNETYPEEGEPEDEALGLLKDAGQELPFIEKAIYKLEKESIPYWNKFLQGYYDTSGIMNEVFDQAVQMSSEGEAGLSDEMIKQGVRMLKAVTTVTYYFAFNMLDEKVGGYTPEQRKLRQAIAIAVNMEEWIQIFDNGRGLPAQGLLPPGIFGHQEGSAGINPEIYDWDEKSGKPIRKTITEAKRLLAEAGYPGGKDKNGHPLTLSFDTAWSGPPAKARFDWLRKQFRKLNIDLQIRQTDYNRFRDKAKKGNYQILFWGWHADYPDPENFLFLLYGPNGMVKHGGENAANYDNQDFNRLFKEMESMPNSSERLDIIKQMLSITQKDAPLIWGYHPVSFGLFHSWYSNTKPMTIGGNTLKYKRLDPGLRETRRQEWNQPVLWPVWLFLGLVILSILPAVYTVWSRERKEVAS
jgi:ABC-type transport system substrate-binding protein